MRVILPAIIVLYFAYCAFTVWLYPYSKTVKFHIGGTEFDLDTFMWQSCYIMPLYSPLLILIQDKPLRNIILHACMANAATLTFSFIVLNDMESNFSFYTNVGLMFIFFAYSWIRLKK